MKLQALRADETGRLRRHHLRPPDRPGRIRIVAVERVEGRMDNGAGLLAGKVHVDQPMLKDLELRQGLTELHPHPSVASMQETNEHDASSPCGNEYTRIIF